MSPLYIVVPLIVLLVVVVIYFARNRKKEVSIDPDSEPFTLVMSDRPVSCKTNVSPALSSRHYDAMKD